MPRKVVAAKRCFFCNSCASDSVNNIRNHCIRCHTDIDELLGLSALTGYKFRRLDEEDNANLLVAIKNEGNPRNVMYCLSCNRTYVSGDSAEPQSLAATFSKHDCSDHVRGPSKRKGLILGPRKKDGVMDSSPKTPVRSDGIWVDLALLDSLKVKYPALANCYNLKDTTDDTKALNFLETLTAMAAQVQEAEVYQRASRQLRTGTVKTPKTRSTDPWADVGCLLLEDDELSDAYDTLTTSATQTYTSALEDWKIASNKDAIQNGLPIIFDDVEMDEDDDTPVEEYELVKPDDNIHRSVIRDALLAEARKLKKVGQKRKVIPPVLEMRPAPAETTQPVAEAPAADCKCEEAPHLLVE